eukprot:3200438-Lingulodinium_polyedra.AAC.1
MEAKRQLRQPPQVPQRLRQTAGTSSGGQATCLPAAVAASSAQQMTPGCLLIGVQSSSVALIRGASPRALA